MCVKLKDWKGWSKMEKLNVCVIFGGASSEHEVSLVSATTVLSNLDKDKYNVHMIGITKDGMWRYYDGAISDIVNFDNDSEKYNQAIISPDRADKGILVLKDGSNNVVENLLMTIFITSVSLLGLPAVTGIWKNSSITTNSNIEDEYTKPEITPPNPCDNCPYNKKETE